MTLIFVVVTGVLLGVAVSLISVRNAADERQRGLQYAASVVGASLIPVIADQDPERIRAEMQSLATASGDYGIDCIVIEDGTGVAIAQTDDPETCGQAVSSDGLIATFTQPQVVRVPVEVEGLEVAVVSVQFQPEGLEQAVYQPLGVTVLVLLVSMIIFGLWGGWMVLRVVVEPIGELRDAAAEIAEGTREIDVQSDRDDEIGDLAAALEDMTRQLDRREKQLRKSYSSLEESFQEKDELARRLEYNMAARSNFVAVASHELRSPLTVIQLYSEMLEDNEFGDLDPGLADAVEAIVSAVARLGAIVSSLLDVALLDRGHMQLDYSQVAMHDIVQHAVFDAQVVGAAAGVDVTLDGDVPELFLRGDAVRLRQVMDNLISNAIKYTSHEREVHVALRADEEWAYACVSDTGPGIDEDRAAIIFEFFGRAETEDNAEVYGLGLGLPISDRIARAHGGSVSFHPNEESGRGTTFCLRIPRHGASADAPESFDAAGPDFGETLEGARGEDGEHTSEDKR